MKFLYLAREQQFLDAVASFQDIGFGRMMQIVSFAYHQYDPIAAFTSGDCVGMLSPDDRKIYEKTKKSDQLDYSIIKPDHTIIKEK